MKLLRKGCNTGVIILFLLVASNFSSCNTSKKRQVLVTYDAEVKQGEFDGAHIDSLKVDIIKKTSDGDYLVAYSVWGQITEEYWNKSMTLKKVRLIEQDSGDISYDKYILLIPVQEYFFGKAGACPTSFQFKNEYLLKNNLEKPITKVMFRSGDKEYLLELD